MKKILVPCDFSKEATNAYRSAISMSLLDEAEILLLHVVDLPVMHDAVLMPVMNYEETLLEALKTKAETQFRTLLEEHESGSIPVSTHVTFGSTSRLILDFVEENNIDLVVMGTKGASGLKEVFIGSNTEKIVRGCNVPVMTVRKPIEPQSIRTIVFPTSIDEHNQEDLMLRVKAVQNFFNATIHLVWINTPTNFASDSKTLPKLESFAKRYMLKDYTLNIYNDIYEESGIIHFARSVNADLLVMGTHGRKGLAHVFGGSVTEDVVNHIELPIWTFCVHYSESILIVNRDAIIW